MLTLAVPLLLSLSAQTAPATPCPSEVQARFDNLERSLRDAELSLDDIGARAVRVRVRRQLDEVRRRAVEARAESCRASSTLVEAPPPPGYAPGVPVGGALPPPTPPPGVQLAPILSDAEHRALVMAIKGESFQDNKLNVLRSGMTGMCLTSSQARAVVQLFNFAKDRGKALELMVPRITDRQMTHQLYGVLKFSSSKKKLRKLLDTVPQHPSCAPG